MTVAFLNRTRKQGARSAVGPVTGLSYLIGPEGAPISALDASGLLAMTEPPCCGETLPFGGEVRSFGAHVPTPGQLALVPESLWNAKPLVPVVKSSRKKIHKEYELEVKIDEQVKEPASESEED